MFSSWIIKRRAIAAVAFSLSIAIGGLASADDEKKEPPQENKAAEKDEVKVEDRYAIPDGDAAALLKFVEKLQKFRPETADEFFEYRKKAPAAMKAAAEKILQLEDDKTSPAAVKAQVILLSAKAAGVATAEPEEQKAIVTEIEGILKEADVLSQEQLGLAFTVASRLEESGNKDLAVESYERFGAMFASQKDETLAGYGNKMLGSARRLNLPGKTMKIEGKLVDGTEFDWKSYRGKVVLVDFWATWCGPCLRELPNVKKHFDMYHDKGFDVVGISLDQDRGTLEEFLAKNELPWKTLFNDGGGWEHPMATYYGVMSIPRVILVDKEGKVISLEARGEELGRLLEEQLGPADAS